MAENTRTLIIDRILRAGVMAVRSTGYAWVVLALGLALSIGLYFVVQDRVVGVATLRFENEAGDASAKIQNGIQSYADVLYSVRALFETEETVDRRQFHDYVESLNLGTRFPGFQIINFAQYVTAERKAAFEAGVRRDASLNGRGYPDFRIQPPGERPAYYVLTYLEPMAGNEASLGSDIAMNLYPTVLRVQERMRDNNELASSGRLVQVLGPEKYVGLSMRLPVYRRGWPLATVEQRRAAYVGSIGAGFRVKQSLDYIIASTIPKPVLFQLYNIGPAGTPATPARLNPDNLLYSNRAGSEMADGGDGLLMVQHFAFGGRELVARFSARRSVYMEPIAQRAAPVAFAAGVTITLLLSALLYSLGRSRNQAQALAAEMTAELNESEAFLVEAQRMSSIGSWLLEGGGGMRWSGEMCRILGQADAGSGAPRPTLGAFLEVVHPSDREAVRGALWRCFERPEREEIEHRLRMPDGAVLWIQTIAERTVVRGERAVRGTSKDVTLRHNTSQRRDTESAVIRALAVTLDVGNATQKVVELVAQGLGLQCGLAWSVDAAGSTLRSAAAWGSDARAWAFLEQCRKASLTADAPLLRRFRKSNEPEWFDNIETEQAVPLREAAVEAGYRRAVFVPVVVETRLAYLLEFCTQDYEPGREELLVFLGRLGEQFAQYLQRRDTENRLKHVATHDSLTQLPNRASFHERLAPALKRAERHGYGLAVLFIDLDRFKVVNDTIGHSAGDRLLQEAAQRFRACLRESDSIARLGGDEFVVLVDYAEDPQQITAVAQRLLDSTGTPFNIDDHELTLGASIGISTYPGDAEDAESLLKNADIAMYRAKQEGRGNFQFYSAALNQYSFERLQAESSLRRGLGRKEFRLHFQPRLDLGTGRMHSMEALLRWQRPGHGLVPPDQFIPMAEETGLIVPIGNWVLQAVCEQILEWERSGLRLSGELHRVSVNLSPRQFACETLLEDIARIVRDSGVHPGLLEFELTESMVMRSPEQAGETLRALKEMGFHLSLDDFGTGYSSLARLKGFPIDCLKLDRTFVKGLPDDAQDAAISRGIIALAHSLRLTVIAEGVETVSQFNFLKSLGCDEIQGYLVSRPVPPSEIPKLVDSDARFKLVAPV